MARKVKKTNINNMKGGMKMMMPQTKQQKGAMNKMMRQMKNTNVKKGK